jgi:phosphoenolpyruvate synthase/pyruvate phosphate dikinase
MGQGSARGVMLRLDADAPPEATIGGKAAGLARLLQLGFPVPPAVVVPVEAHGEIGDPDAVVGALGEPLAVRSSAVGEDAPERSSAGQYESVMGVRLASLAVAVRRVHGSASAGRALAYRGEEAPMAVLIQREIDSTRAGVAFSRDPVDASDDVYVESVFGHGERLVSGLATPDRYWVDAAGSVRARLALRDGSARTLRTLRDDEARAVADLTRSAERGFGGPVDLEFCFDPAGAPWVVQCRPITTLPRPA